MSELTTVVYAVDDEPVAGQWVGRTMHEFDDTVSLLKKAITRHDLWTIQEINPQALLNQWQLSIRKARQILFFHPRFMQRLLIADARALPQMPLKIVVMEGAIDEVIVRVPDIQMALAPYRNMETLAVELEALVTDILGTVCSHFEKT